MSKNMKRLSTLLAAVSIIIASIIGYGINMKTEQIQDDKIHVTVTTTFLGDLVEQIGGDKVVVTRLMGPGIDPHQFQASNSDLEKLTSADLIFYGGLHLEAKLGEILEKLAESGKPIVDTSKMIPKANLLYSEELTEEEIAELEEDEGLYDPHIWFDIDLWRIVTNTVTKSLINMDTESTDFYQKNMRSYFSELDELEVYVKTRLAEIPEVQRYLITAHDAFNYFSVYTGMEVRGIQGVNTTVEAGTSDVSDTANFIVEHQIKAIFIESSISPKLVQALQESVNAKGFKTEIGGELFSDSTGNLGEPEGTYIGMYKHNVDTIVSALK